MEVPKERLVASVSPAELERRWKAAREVMRNRKIDFLVMRQDEEFYGGYVRWFSAITPRHSYPFTVIFPVDDEMATISSAPPGQGQAAGMVCIRREKEIGSALLSLHALYEHVRCGVGCEGPLRKERCDHRLGGHIIPSRELS